MNISEHLKQIKTIMYEAQENNFVATIINEATTGCIQGDCKNGVGTLKIDNVTYKGTFINDKLVKGTQQFNDGSYYKFDFPGSYDKCGPVTYTTPGGFTTPTIKTKYWTDGNCRAEGWKSPDKKFKKAADKWTQKSNCVAQFKGSSVVPWNNDDSIIIQVTLNDGSYIQFFDNERFYHFNQDGSFFKGDKESSKGSIKCK